jgi:hypothetical protein
MTRSTMSFSYEEIGAQILRSEMMEDHMRERAEKIADMATSLAVVSDRPSDPHRGRYRYGEGGIGGFKVSTVRSGGGYKGDRCMGTVENNAPEAAYQEFGTSTQPGRHTLHIAQEGAAYDA